MKLATAFLACAFFASDETSFEKALRLYNAGRYEASLGLLPENRTSPETDNLIGRNYYMLGDFKKASDFFKKAAESKPQNSGYQLWLGRAFGRRAENSGPFSAARHAVEAKKCFEESVRLDPQNPEALSDLFEYYLSAPKFMGGGVHKAEAAAKRISKINRAEGHSALAKIAEKKKKFDSAEHHLRKALKLEPKAGYLVDLAKFLARRGRFEESKKAFSEAEKISPGNPAILFEKADSCLQTKRDPDIARELLNRYLAADVTPDMPQRFEAEKLLKRIPK